MSRSLSAVDEAFRQKAVDWLDGHVADFGLPAREGLSLEQDVELARRWQKVKSENGYAVISWPAPWGPGGTVTQQALFATEESKRGFPAGHLVISLGMPTPMVLRYASDELKERFVPPAIRGETLWAQLFSEPAAGSDLAGLRMRAKRQGDDWVLSGQKVWTTLAQFCDYGVCVARHDPSLPKHKGLTYFIVDLKAPGVTVRPIRQLTGEAHFNEVFFDDVVVPDVYRLGGVGDGFKLAIETLMMERYTAAADETGFGPTLARFIELAAETPGVRGETALDDGGVRAEIARTYALQQGLVAIHGRALAEMSAGRTPGPEGSIHKLASVRHRQHLSTLALDLLGPDGLRQAPGVNPKTDFHYSWLDAPTLRIAGGTDEVLLNTIAEKILGLPQDHRPDKGVPFDEIPS